VSLNTKGPRGLHQEHQHYLMSNQSVPNLEERQQGNATNHRLRVTHEPDSECEPYSAIRGLPKDPHNELCALLASLSVVEAISRAAADDL
jgi:hypothetical protein